jgi:hypothetical protein
MLQRMVSFSIVDKYNSATWNITFYLDVVLYYLLYSDTYYIYVVTVEYIPFTLTHVSINERLVYVSEQLLTMSTLQGNINIGLR